MKPLHYTYSTPSPKAPKNSSSTRNSVTAARSAHYVISLNQKTKLIKLLCVKRSPMPGSIFTVPTLPVYYNQSCLLTCDSSPLCMYIHTCSVYLCLDLGCSQDVQKHECHVFADTDKNSISWQCHDNAWCQRAYTPLRRVFMMTGSSSQRPSNKPCCCGLKSNAPRPCRS